MYEFSVDGVKYYVESESHNYRKRFYAIRINASLDWDRMGYIGSYMPGSKTCGYADNDWRFSTDCKGPKTAAHLCLIAFLSHQTVEVN